MRQGELDSRFVEFEKGLESNEGLAEYAGVKAVFRAVEAASQKRAAIPFKNIDKGSYIADRFERLRRITRVGRNSRLRFYDTGAAQALLLDRLMPGWKKRVQATAAAVQDLVEEATINSGDVLKQVAETALRQYGYEDVLRSEQEVAERKLAERRALLDSVLNRQGRRYVIDVSALGRVGDLTSFDPMNVTMINGQTRVHTRILSVAEAGSYKATFEQPVVEDIAAKKYVTISKPDQNEVLVDGAPLDMAAPAERSFQMIRITTPGFKFEATSGVVATDGQAVTVRVGRKEISGPSVAGIDSRVGISSSRSRAVSDSILKLGLSDLDGKLHRLADLKGNQAYLLFICAQDWARPAHNYFDALNAGGEKSPAARLIVIASQNSPGQVRDFLSGRQSRLAVWIDETREVADYFNLKPAEHVSYPFVVGIDASGRINFEQFGFTAENVEAMKRLLFASSK